MGNRPRCAGGFPRRLWEGGGKGNQDGRRPAALSAVAIEVTDATALDFPGGTVLTTPVTDGLRAVLLLDEPGPVDFFVTPATDGVAPTAIVIDAADATRDVPESLEAYRVVFR